MSTQTITQSILTVLLATVVGFLAGWYGSGERISAALEELEYTNEQATIANQTDTAPTDSPSDSELSPSAEEPTEFIDIEDENIRDVVGQELYDDYLTAAELINNELMPEARQYMENDEEVPAELMAEIEENEAIINDVIQVYLQATS